MLNIPLLKELIKQDMQKKQLGFKRYCADINIPYETLRDILRGRHTHTRILTAIKLSQKLNIDLDELII